MRKSLAVVAGLTMVLGTRAQAQSPSCPGATLTEVAAQDACQMAVDVFQVMAPQLGLALAGGNATLGRGSALGGPGHFSVGLRANLFNGDVPDVTSFPDPQFNGAVQRTGASALPAGSRLLGLPTFDAAVGLFGGVPLGLTNVGGIDLLVSASYVPTIGSETDDIQVKPDRNLQLGYGVRVGLLQESLVVPGVAFTYLKRDLPTTTITGTSPNLDVFVSDLAVKTSAYRVVASKSLVLFGLAAGVGQDRYDQSANVQGVARDNVGGSFTSPIVPLSQKLTRTNYFLDLSLNLPVIKLVGEIGQVTGGTVDTYNEFETGRADKSRTYGSLGLRLGL